MKLNTRFKKFLAVGVGLFLMLSFAVGYSLTGKQTFPAEATTFKFQQEVLEGLTDSEAFFNELALVHEEMNIWVCWGRSETFRLSDFESNRYKDFRKSITKMINLCKYEPLEEDLKTALDLLDNSVKNQDIKSFVKVHRILHDLDSFIMNPRSDKNYFGVTKTLEIFE